MRTSIRDYSRLDQYMKELGADVVTPGVYSHELISNEIDLTASSEDPKYIIATIIKLAIEQGKKQKIKEINEVLLS